MKLLTLVFFISVFFATLSFSQTLESQKKFRDAQDSIYTYLYTNTDKAENQIQYLLKQTGEMADTTKAITYNLFGTYLNLIGELDSSIVIFQKALKTCGDNKYRKLGILSNIGTAYRNNCEYNESRLIFEDLKTLYLNENDSLGYAKVQGELGGIFNLTLQHEKAVKHLTEAIEIYEKYGGSKIELGVILQRLANSYLKQEKFDFALEIYEKTLENFKEAKRMDNYYLTLVNVADCYQYKSDYKKALETINESIKGLKPFKNDHLLAAAYGVKGDALKKLKYYQRSKSAYEKAISFAYKSGSSRTLQIAREFLSLLIIQQNQNRIDQLILDTEPFYDDANIEYQYSYLEVLSEAYAFSQQFDKACKASKQSHILKDSSYYQNKKELVDDIQALYRVNEREKENRELNNTIEEKEESISILSLSIIVLFVMIVFIIIILLTRTNYQKRILSLEKERSNDLNQKLKFEQENIQLKEQLIEKQKTELLGYSLEVANVNEKIDNLIKESEKSGDNEHVGKQLKSLITVNKSWDSFIARFKETDPEFIPRLSKAYPKLTQKDLEFCSLVRINISYKDIANFLQISHESVFKKRYRIAQKMELEKGTEFQQFIIQF